MDVCNSHLLEKGKKIDLSTCLVLSGTWNRINTSWKCKRLFSTYAKVIFIDLFAIINNGYDGNANLTLQTISLIISCRFTVNVVIN